MSGSRNQNLTTCNHFHFDLWPHVQPKLFVASVSCTCILMSGVLFQSISTTSEFSCINLNKISIEHVGFYFNSSLNSEKVVSVFSNVLHPKSLFYASLHNQEYTFVFSIQRFFLFLFLPKNVFMKNENFFIGDRETAYFKSLPYLSTFGFSLIILQ